MSSPKVHWLVENEPFEDDIYPMLQEIERQGHDLRLIKYNILEREIYRNFYAEDACVFFYGSINLSLQLQKETPWVPGPIVNMTNYKTSVQVANWNKYLLNKDGIFLPYGELKRRIHSKEIKKLPIDEYGRLFIRPDTGNKLFTGQVILVEDSKNDFLYLDSRCRNEDMIYISSALKMGTEYRLIVADDKIIAGCQYRKDGNLETTIDSHVPQHVLNKAKFILEDSQWRPDRAFVMDVHEDRLSGDVDIIELNAISCSGLYASNCEPIVRELSRIALEEWKDIFEI